MLPLHSTPAPSTYASVPASPRARHRRHGMLFCVHQQHLHTQHQTPTDGEDGRCAVYHTCRLCILQQRQTTIVDAREGAGRLRSSNGSDGDLNTLARAAVAGALSRPGVRQAAHTARAASLTPWNRHATSVVERGQRAGSRRGLRDTGWGTARRRSLSTPPSAVMSLSSLCLESVKLNSNSPR